MSKITIKELCDKLKNDISEKGLFFKELSAQEFLIPFQKEGLLNFTVNASYWVMQYLGRIYNSNNKNIILEIVNKNIKEIKINDIHYSTYYQLTNLLDKFDITDLNKIDYIKLLKHKHAIELVKSMYKKEQIIEYEDLIKATVSTLLTYEVKSSSFDKRANVTYETYYLSEIINDEVTKENFNNALSQEFLFDYLIEKYNEVYFKTHDNLNDISDVFKHQKIDMKEINKSFVNDYTSNDVSDIILYFLCLNLSTSKDITCNIKKLLSQRIFMLRKLGLYLIYQNSDKYIDLLKEFFKYINKKNVVKVTNICLYELVQIFKSINKIENSDSLNDDINVYLDKFPQNGESVKYNVLHGLKDHLEFKKQFYDLKEKYQYEIENPGIYWQSGVGGWVRNVSPISEKDFKLKSIKEQIEYVNQDREYKHNLIQFDEESVEEVNERGLIDLFKKIVSKNVNIYLDDSIINLKKVEFIAVFIEVLSQNVEKITSFNKVILFIDNVFNLIIQDKKDYKSLLYELINFNNSVVNKSHRNFKKIFKYIKQIARCDYDESYYKNEYDISFIALNTMHGRNFQCYMEHLTKVKKLNDEDKNFLEYILLEENEDRLCTFYYYLGMQYDYLCYNYKKLHLFERVCKLKGKAKKYFLNGYLSYFRYLPQFRDLKLLILEAFKKNEIKENAIRTRFVRMLLDLKFKFNEDEIFNEFSNYFSEKDYQDLLNGLKYRDNPNYPKEKVMQFWIDMVKIQNKSFTVPLLAIFNRYCSVDDIEKFQKELKSIIKLGFPKNLIAHNCVEQFLEKVLCYLKTTNQSSATVYNLIVVFISAFSDVEYLHKEIDVIINILNEFEKLDKFENAKLIAQKMYKIPCLKFYAEKYKKFLI